jgi:hypothetical protein
LNELLMDNANALQYDQPMAIVRHYDTTKLYNQTAFTAQTAPTAQNKMHVRHNGFTIIMFNFIIAIHTDRHYFVLQA